MFKKNKDMLFDPSENKTYMNNAQLAYFKRKLLNWKKELEYELHITKKYLQQEEKNDGDLYDHVNREIHIVTEINNRKQYRQLIYKINQTLERIEHGTYRCCAEVAELIGIEHLEVQPVATLSIEVRKKQERYNEANLLQKLEWQWI